jgi:hypothetical protein
MQQVFRVFFDAPLCELFTSLVCLCKRVWRRKIRLMQKAMQNVVIYKNLPAIGLCGSCLSVTGPDDDILL